MNKEEKGLRQLIRQKRDTDRSIKKKISPEKRKEQVKKWTTFYRRNLDIYAEERLRIKLRPFQRIMLHMMGVSQVWFAICSRGISKTFIVGLYSVCVCLLKPYSEVVITASTIDQGRKMIEEKIRKELINKLSPVLSYLYKNEKITIKANKDEALVSFFNGSSIKVLPPLDSSRGERATVLIYEECRLLKKGDVDSIFEPMLHPRQSIFSQKEEYSANKDYVEDGISIYITSARYKIEWFWRMFKKVVQESFLDSKVIYNFFAADIFIALKYNLKTQREWLKIQKSNNDLDLKMEYLNEMVGEAENAYFQLDLMKKCQRLHKAFKPTTDKNIMIGKELDNREKKDNEIRILAIDFAFSNTTKNGQANDNTVIECISGFYDKGGIIRNVDYIETLGGGESEKTQKRVRELFYDYKADFIICDLRSGGEVMYNNLTKPYVHPTRNPNEWDEHGFTVVLDNSYQFVTNNKIDDLYNRRIDPDAKQCIIPIQGNLEFNDLAWRSLRANMVNNKIRLLIDDLEFDTELAKRKGYHKMSSEDKMLERLPYVQTEFLINEAINLRQQLREGKIKLYEPRSGTKDRIVTLAYGSVFFDKLENKMSKEDQKNDFDEDDWFDIMIV